MPWGCGPQTREAYGIMGGHGRWLRLDPPPCVVPSLAQASTTRGTEGFHISHVVHCTFIFRGCATNEGFAWGFHISQQGCLGKGTGDTLTPLSPSFPAPGWRVLAGRLFVCTLGSRLFPPLRCSPATRFHRCAGRWSEFLGRNWSVKAPKRERVTSFQGTHDFI